eukprot:3792948-Amphidinium_carterae.1
MTSREECSQGIVPRARLASRFEKLVVSWFVLIGIQFGKGSLSVAEMGTETSACNFHDVCLEDGVSVQDSRWDELLEYQARI